MVLTQKQKNILMSKCERKMQKIESKLLKIGNTGTTENLMQNEALLADYEYLENKISMIQFRDLEK